MNSELVTKKDLLKWISSLIKMQVKCLEDLSNGVGFCLLLNYLNPSKMKMNKVNHKAKLEHENLANLKILAIAMMENGLDKTFDALRIAKRKSQDILELLQWFRKLFFTREYSLQERKTANDSQKLQNIKRSSSQMKPQTMQMNYPLPLKTPSFNPESTPNSSLSLKSSILSQNIPINCQKRLPSENQQEPDFKNCLKINKAIEKVVYDQQTSSDLKLDIIKNILFKNTFSQKKEEIPHTYNQNPNDSSFMQPIQRENEEKVNQSYLNEKETVKIEHSPYQNEPNFRTSISTSLISNRTSVIQDSVFKSNSKNLF